LRRVEDEGEAFLPDLLIGLGSLMSEGKSARDLPRLLAALDRAYDLDDPRLLLWAANTAGLVRQETRYADLQRRAATQARASGAIDALVLVLTSRVINGVVVLRNGGRPSVGLIWSAVCQGSRPHRPVLLLWCGGCSGGRRALRRRSLLSV
jgi:hypothetical protein